MMDLIPYRADKNLGKAYNEVFEKLPNESALCIRDYDTLWLTHDYNKHLDEYHRMHPNAVLTCFTNRVSPLSVPQLLSGRVDQSRDIALHIRQAEKLRKKYLEPPTPFGSAIYMATEITRDISGMMMVIPRSVWLQYPFPEDKLCLGVDTFWGREIRAAGIKILRMDGLYLWHSYRLLNGIHDKQHLK